MSYKDKSELKNRSYLFSIDIIKYISTLPNSRVFWVISDQLLRAATSIGANIIEAQAASSRKDFIRYFEIALKSAKETKYWLGLLRDATKVDKSKVNALLTDAAILANLLGASLLTLKGKRKF